jgi:hypothetical protein
MGALAGLISMAFLAARNQYSCGSTLTVQMLVLAMFLPSLFGGLDHRETKLMQLKRDWIGFREADSGLFPRIHAASKHGLVLHESRTKVK